MTSVKFHWTFLTYWW